MNCLREGRSGKIGWHAGGGGAGDRAVGVVGRMRTGSRSRAATDQRGRGSERDGRGHRADGCSDRGSVSGGGRSAHVYRRGAGLHSRRPDHHRCALRRRGHGHHVRRRVQGHRRPGVDLEGRRDLPRPAMGEEPGSAGGLRDPARGARRRRVGRGGRGWRTHSGFRAESRHGRVRDRLRAWRRRRSGRLPGADRVGARRLPVAAVRRSGRRHQRRTVDLRADHHRIGRRPRRRRV